jgi:hypothetical protein
MPPESEKQETVNNSNGLKEFGAWFVRVICSKMFKIKYVATGENEEPAVVKNSGRECCVFIGFRPFYFNLLGC